MRMRRGEEKPYETGTIVPFTDRSAGRTKKEDRALTGDPKMVTPERQVALASMAKGIALVIKRPNSVIDHTVGTRLNQFDFFSQSEPNPDELAYVLAALRSSGLRIRHDPEADGYVAFSTHGEDEDDDEDDGPGAV